MPKCPKAPPRRPGEIGRLRIDRRFAEVLTPASPLPSGGSFVSAFVAEDLEDLRAQELKAIGRSVAPKTFDGAHRRLVDMLKKEQRRRQKVARM